MKEIHVKIQSVKDALRVAREDAHEDDLMSRLALYNTAAKDMEDIEMTVIAFEEVLRRT